MRIELPPDLHPAEARKVVAAVEAYLAIQSVRPSPWALAGRTEDASLGALQIRHQSRTPWGEIRLNPYTRLGTEKLMGRGDAK